MILGEELSKVLSKIEDTLWWFEAKVGQKPGFTDEGFKAGVKIFSSVLMDKIFELQEAENLDVRDRLAMATKAGEDIRKLVKIYTGIDTYELYDKKKEE